MTKENDTSNSGSNSAPRGLFVEGIFISIAMTAAYILVFSYQAGYAGVYDIPLELIDITLTQLLITATTSVAVVFFIVLIASDFWHIRRNSKHSLDYALRVLFLLFMVGTLLIGYFFNYDKKAWLSLIGLITVIAVWSFVPPLIFQRGNITYKEKYETHRRQVVERDKASLAYAIAQRFGRYTLMILWLFVGSVGLAGLAGRYSAQHQEQFYVLDRQHEQVVLRIYSPVIIAAPFNREKKQITSQLAIYALSQDIPLTMHKEKIGPLHLAHE